MLRRMIEKLCDRMNIQKSAGFPWSKGVPDRNFPRPVTGGSGCMAPVIIFCAISLGLLGILFLG
jgi:hypothetical protein